MEMNLPYPALDPTGYRTISNIVKQYMVQYFGLRIAYRSFNQTVEFRERLRGSAVFRLSRI
jgi:hypothetical protein